MPMLASWILLLTLALPGAWPVPAGKAVDDLAPGKLLVSARSLSDPNFAQTVVLLVHYDEHGALGLIINRPTELEVARVLPDVPGLTGQDRVVYQGGPVAMDAVAILVMAGNAPEGALRVTGDVYFSRSRSLLRRLMSERDRWQRLRVYAGHSGWAPGQLENEVERGDWHVIESDGGWVFDDRPMRLWKDLVPRDPARSARLLRSPRRPSG